MKEYPESLISASLLGQAVAGLVVDSDQIHWILLVVIHHFPIGVNERGSELQALKLIGRLGSATTRRGILKGLALLASFFGCAVGARLVLDPPGSWQCLEQRS
jgi:hypothetical protein